MHLIDDAIADSSQRVVGETGPVGGHCVFRSDSSHRANATVGPIVAHDADRANGQENGEVLPNLSACAQCVDLFAHHRVRASQQLEILPRDRPNDAYGEARAREGLAVDDLGGQSERAADIANLVLEEKAQWFDESKGKIRGESTDVVMGLDLDRGFRVGRGAFDDIRIERPLRQKIERSVEVGLRLKGADELVSDDPSFLLRVGDAIETREKAGAGIDRHEFHPKRATENIAHEVCLSEPQEAVVDKNRRQAVADCAVDEGRCYRGINATTEPEEDPAIADRLLDLSNGTVDEMLRGPVRLAITDIDQEIAQQIASERRVRDFRVELNSKAPPITHPGNRSIVRAGDPYITGWEARNVIAVAHPDIQRCGQIPEEWRWLRYLDRRRAIFAVSSRLDAAVESAGDQLHAIADAQHRNVLAQHP